MVWWRKKGRNGRIESRRVQDTLLYLPGPEYPHTNTIAEESVWRNSKTSNQSLVLSRVSAVWFRKGHRNCGTLRLEKSWGWSSSTVGRAYCLSCSQPGFVFLHHIWSPVMQGLVLCTIKRWSYWCLDSKDSVSAIADRKINMAEYWIYRI